MKRPVQSLQKHHDWQTLVETLSTKIARYSQDPAFQRNELQTRYALVDPMLRACGWDPEEPSLVHPEFRISPKRIADYALFIGNKPVMLGETKSLPVQDLADARTQGADYCKTSAVRFLFVTNGQRWEVYDTYQTASVPPTAQFDVVRDTLDEITHHARCLRKEELKKPPSVAVADWQPPSKSRPTQIQFPDGSAVPVSDRKWKTLVVSVARWLVQAQSLTPANCSIRKTPQSDRYVVSCIPTHPIGRPFIQPGTIPFPDGQTCYVDAHSNTPENARAIHTLITATGQDPAQFRVWFA